MYRVVFSMLLLTLLPLWDSLATSCSVSLAASALHAVCVWALVLGHYSAFGNASAAYVCLLRFGVTGEAEMSWGSLGQEGGIGGLQIPSGK